MLYNIYKNCSAEEFKEVKDILESIKIEIAGNFSLQITPVESFDSADTLDINFTIRDLSNFNGGLGIAYEDIPGPLTFFLAIFKFVDLNEWRFLKRESIFSNKSLSYYEANANELMKIALDLYHSWTPQDVMQSQKIKLGYEGPG